MRFWDTSALVALFVNQPQTTLAREAFRDDPEAVLWWATQVEYESAIHRLHREGILDEGAVTIARESLTALREGAIEVQPSDELRARAVRLLAEHRLRAADALQLASALLWAGEPPRGSEFVCFDDRLRESAGGEGFTVLPRTL